MYSKGTGNMGYLVSKDGQQRTRPFRVKLKNLTSSRLSNSQVLKFERVYIYIYIYMYTYTERCKHVLYLAKLYLANASCDVALPAMFCVHQF